MSSPNGIIVTFPGEGSIFAPVRAGQTIKDFQDVLEQYYLATFCRPGKVEALLHPDFYPESEVQLPLHDDAMQTFQYARGLVAKMQEPWKHQQPRAVGGCSASTKQLFGTRTLEKSAHKLDQIDKRWRDQLRDQVQQQLLQKPLQLEHNDTHWQGWQEHHAKKRWGRDEGNANRAVATASQDSGLTDGLFQETKEHISHRPITDTKLAQSSTVDDADFQEALVSLTMRPISIDEAVVQGLSVSSNFSGDPAEDIKEPLEHSLPLSEELAQITMQGPSLQETMLLTEPVQETNMGEQTNARPALLIESVVHRDTRKHGVEDDSEEDDGDITGTDTDMEPSVRTVDTDVEPSEFDASSDSEEEIVFLDSVAALNDSPRNDTQEIPIGSQRADTLVLDEQVCEVGANQSKVNELACSVHSIDFHEPMVNEDLDKRNLAEDPAQDGALVEEAMSNVVEDTRQEDARAAKQLASTGVDEYGSHAWPSCDNILRLLHPKSAGAKSLKDPTDLSDLPLSESEEKQEDEEQEPSQSRRPAPFQRPAFAAKQNVQLTPSALSPKLSSKHAKNVHMQRMVYKEMERRRLRQHELTASQLSRPELKLAQKRQADLLLSVLKPFGYTDDDVWALLVSLDFDTDAVQQEVDKIIEELLAGGLENSAWSVSITRKSQRVANLQNLKKEELGYLKTNFGKATKTLDAPVVESSIEIGVGGQVEDVAGPSQLKACPDQGRTRAEPLVADGGEMPSESSIDGMSCRECRDLLLRMTPLVHAPTALYLALGKRAVEEYVRLEPRTLFDCREVTFWQFPNSHGSDHKRQYASKVFFEVLSNEESALFAGRLREIHPICAVHMLVTMEEARSVVNSVFQEVARFVAEHLAQLDRDALSRLVLVFARAGVQNPGLFNLVAQECLRRLKFKECEHSLSPKVLCDLFVAFEKAKIWDEELFENLMLRAVSLFDADVKQPEIDQTLCGASISLSGRIIPAAAFRLMDLTLICRSLLGLHKPDQEFFRDVADHAIACLKQAPAVADRFVGNPEIALSQFAQVFARGQMFFPDLFEMLKATAARHKQRINAKNLKSLWLALQEQRRDEDKKERKKSQPPERRRGAMGRAVVQASAPELRQPRRAKAREQRQRLAELNESELAQEVATAERYSGLSNSAKILMSGLKLDAVLDAQEAPKDGKKIRSHVMEASEWTNMKGRPKGSRKQLHEELVVAQREARKQSAALVASKK